MYIRKNIDDFQHLKFLTSYLEGHKGFIAGGCFKNIFKKEQIKDIDIFFKNQDDFNDAVIYFEEEQLLPIYYENEKVVAFRRNRNSPVIELIKQTFGTPKEILDKFDFSITKFALYQAEPGLFDEFIENKPLEILYHQDYFQHLLENKLVLEPNLLFPVSTFERVLRYTKYGYGLCKGSKINLINSLRNNILNGDVISNNLYFGID